MTTKTKTASRTVNSPGLLDPEGGPWLTPPWSMDERLERIKGMGQRIDTYIQFMCQVAALHGTSTEAKDRAVKAFYDRMVLAENQLGRIQEELRLG